MLAVERDVRTIPISILMHFSLFALVAGIGVPIILILLINTVSMSHFFIVSCLNWILFVFCFALLSAVIERGVPTIFTQSDTTACGS